MADVILAKLETMESEVERYKYSAPFGILYLADSLEKAGFSVRLMHEEGSKTNIRKLLALVSEEKPLLVGFSTFTAPSIIPTIQASMEIKKRHDIPIVWGGYHPTIAPEQTLMNDFIDLVTIGEGERTIVELANVLHEHGMDTQELVKVAGIGFKENGEAVFTRPRPLIKNLDDIYPAWHHLDIERYFYSGKNFYSGLRGEKVIALITSRGCPWRCGYCFNQAVNKRRFRAQSAQRVISEIHDLKERLGIAGVLFEDDNFFTDKRRALEIVRSMSIPWTSTMRVDDLAEGGEDFVKTLAQSRCIELRFGAESGSQRVLDLLTKDITVDQIRRTAELCGKHGIKAVFMFMYGFPGETWTDICQTLDVIDGLEGMNEYVVVSHLGFFAPFPGTPLFDVAVKEGFKPPTSLEGWGAPMGEIAKHKGKLPPYVDKRAKSLSYYRHIASRKDLDEVKFSLPVKVLQQLARFRWKHRFFSFPFDHIIPAACGRGLDRWGLLAIRRALYARRP
jgi:anaerobic magnesium-protoporphyrin IX monomethyl ester cyclase